MFNLHYAAMFMMTSQILKFLDFTKTQKSRCLENETFFLQIKKIQQLHIKAKNAKAKKLLYGKKYFYGRGNL